MEPEMEDIEIDFEDYAQEPEQGVEAQPAEKPAPIMKPKVPTTLLDYLAQTEEEIYTKLYDFAIETFLFNVRVKDWHLSAKSGFWHEKLEEAYKILEKFADRLAETTMAYTKEGFNFNTKVFQLNHNDFNDNYVVSKLIEYRDAAVSVSKNLATNRSISSIFDDMLANLDQVIGLMRNFK